MAIPAPRSGAAALVTGASSGIGRELARGLARRGHDLVLVARREERLEALAVELRALGCRVHVHAADVSRREEREHVLAAIAAEGLEVDVLAPCAGFGAGGLFCELEADCIELMLRTNLEAVLALTRALAPGMAARRRGAILLVSSVAGRQPVPRFGVYAATKAAVTSLGEALHWELGREGVTVSVLAPGSVSTEFGAVAGLSAQEGRTPAALRIGADECAAAALAGLERGDRIITPRRAVRLSSWLGAHAPRRLVLGAAGRALS